MLRTRTMLAACLFAAPVALAGTARAEMLKFHGDLNAASEVPPHATDGKGLFDGTLDTSTKVLTYTLTYSGLTGPATAAHLHGPASPGVNAGVSVPIAAPLATPVKGTATLTDAQVTDLEAGKMYANVHTDANKGGEIRGQVTQAK